MCEQEWKGHRQCYGWERAGVGGTDQEGLTCSPGSAHSPPPQGPAVLSCSFPEMAKGPVQGFRWLPQPPLNFLPQGPAPPANGHHDRALSQEGLGPRVPLSWLWQGWRTLTGGMCLPRRLRGRVARALIAVQKSVSSESSSFVPY